MIRSPKSTRTVKGKDYLYYIHYENGIKKTVYCGLSSKSESKRKAMKLEIESIKEQKRELSEKVIELESKIKSL